MSSPCQITPRRVFHELHGVQRNYLFNWWRASHYIRWSDIWHLRCCKQSPLAPNFYVLKLLCYRHSCDKYGLHSMPKCQDLELLSNYQGIYDTTVYTAFHINMIQVFLAHRLIRENVKNLFFPRKLSLSRHSSHGGLWGLSSQNSSTVLSMQN